jgi:RNA polymerase sigma factor (sigma-70 family)
MNATRPAEILRRLERADGAPDADADLLARFVATRDAAAFAELVRRHGALVFGVCRRVTGHPQDAEDAFQAAFLVLAKKAGSLRNAALLGNWLYGVAFRVAWRAKRSVNRRRAREVPVAVLPDPPAPVPSSPVPELAPILDEELAALPACYRDAIVLCDLRGASREEAAAALGVPEGTLSSRLANGRKKLAARLTKRGIALSAAALPLVVAEASTAVPNDLVTKTSGLVADWAAGGTVPASLTRLADGGFTVRKMLALGVVMVVGVAGAVLAARPDAAPNDPAKPPPAVAEKPDAAPAPKGDPKPADQPAVAFTTAPRMVSSFDANLTGYPTPMWNTTGTHLALYGASVTGKQEFVEPAKSPLITTVPAMRLYSLGGKEKGAAGYPNDAAQLVAVLPDGSGVVTDIREYRLISGHHQLNYWAVKAPRGGPAFEQTLEPAKTIELDLPETHGYAFSADMKTFRTVAWERTPDQGITKLEVLEVDTETGKAKKSLLKIDYEQHMMSANGKRLATIDKAASKVVVYDLDRGAKLSEATIPGEKLADLPPTVQKTGWGTGGGWGGGAVSNDQQPPLLVLSPDGKRAVVARAVGQTTVINTDNGEVLPALEGIKDARVSPGGKAFSGDGRLLAMSGATYKLGKATLGGGFGGLGGGKGAAEKLVWEQGASFLTVWDTQTGKVLKSWGQGSRVAFNPARPLLAIIEPNGQEKTRVGFWDFSAEVEKK